MPATTAGVIKGVIESAGLGVSVYRDAAPSKPGPDGTPVLAVPLPYVSVRERLVRLPDRDGVFDADVPHTVTETVQIDVWQTWRDVATGRVVESYTLPDAIERLLTRGPVGGAPFRVYAIRCVDSVRLLEADENVVHHAITAVVHREA